MLGMAGAQRPSPALRSSSGYSPGPRAFDHQLLEIAKHCVLAVCAIKNVKAVRPATHEIGIDEICQFLLHRGQGDIAAAGQLADIHLAARIKEQRAQQFRPHLGKKKI
jgi:hypothetical protein